MQIRGFPQITPSPAMTLGGLRPGGRFTLYIEDLPDADARGVVVLYRRAGEWIVVFPELAEEEITLADLPSEQGKRRLDLSAGPEPGQQTWAIALPQVPGHVDWPLPADRRWRQVQQQIAQKRCPIVTEHVDVDASS